MSAKYCAFCERKTFLKNRMRPCRFISYERKQTAPSNPNPPEQQTLKDAQKFVFGIHVRARNNAFAHREAANEVKLTGDRWTVSNLVATTFALLFTALALVFQGDKFWGVALTTVSISCSFIALFTQSILLWKRFDTAETMHTYFQQSFQFISQRAREIERPQFDIQNIRPLIDDLERDFAIIKARAIEPQDRHFKAAAILQKEIRTQPEYSGALSFPEMNGTDRS